MTAFEFEMFDFRRVQIKNGKQPTSRHLIGITNRTGQYLEFENIMIKLNAELVEIFRWNPPSARASIRYAVLSRFAALQRIREFSPR